MRMLGSHDPRWGGAGSLSHPGWPGLSSLPPAPTVPSGCSCCVASGLRDSPQGWEGSAMETDNDIAACAPRSRPPRSGCTPHGLGEVGPMVWGMSWPRGFSQD